MTSFLSIRLLVLTWLLAAMPCLAQSPTVRLSTPVSPPSWALLQRELLEANTAACREFYARYFDERGYLLCVERWGGDDGPDDAIENCTDWPLLHALGADDIVLKMYRTAWEGHLRQYTAAKTTHVPFARDGMYYKEFPVMFDWLHNAEGLTVFNLQGLSDPGDARFGQRVRRYAGFYMNEDPGAPNYDARHRIIRSLFNGSRGPLLRKANGVDWAGDPIEVKNRFHLGHGEESYEQMVEHFKDYNDIVGDHPLNLSATTLVLNAYLLTGEEKYRRWLLEYVDAWRERMASNGDLIPTNIGLDGKIGSACGGRWYGGVYGWSHSTPLPPSGRVVHRNLHGHGFIGFMNAYLLTGDDRYLEPWRKQADKINGQAKVVDGRSVVPTMYGDKGWYAYLPARYTQNRRELWLLSMKPEDRRHVPDDAWMRYLEGKNPEYPEQALRQDLEQVRQRVAGMRRDTTTPDTRLADDPMKFNPASVTSLVEQRFGGPMPGRRATVLFSRLRYFDPERRRAGLPEGIAALIEKLRADEAEVTLVNLNQLDAKTVIIQAGAYGEHQMTQAVVNGVKVALDRPTVTVRLEPGCGGRVVFRMRRFVNTPTMTFPWDRSAGSP